MSSPFLSTAYSRISQKLDRHPLLKLEQLLEWKDTRALLNANQDQASANTKQANTTTSSNCSKPSRSDRGITDRTQSLRKPAGTHQPHPLLRL